jgi:hypothetical protein
MVLFVGAENLGISWDSAYTRIEGISGGTPMSDGLHFGQTIITGFVPTLEFPAAYSTSAGFFLWFSQTLPEI